MCRYSLLQGMVAVPTHHSSNFGRGRDGVKVASAKPLAGTWNTVSLSEGHLLLHQEEQLSLLRLCLLEILGTRSGTREISGRGGHLLLLRHEQWCSPQMGRRRPLQQTSTVHC